VAVRLTSKLIDHDKCIAGSSVPSDDVVLSGSDHSNYVLAEILGRRDTRYSGKMIKVCVISVVDGLRVGDERIIIANKEIDDHGCIFPMVQTLQEKLNARRIAGGRCVWTFC